MLKSHTQVVCPQFYTKSIPQLPVVHRTRTSLFSESNIIVLDCPCLQVCVCVCFGKVFFFGLSKYLPKSDFHLPQAIGQVLIMWHPFSFFFFQTTCINIHIYKLISWTKGKSASIENCLQWGLRIIQINDNTNSIINKRTDLHSTWWRIEQNGPCKMDLTHIKSYIHSFLVYCSWKYSAISQSKSL